MAKTALTLLPRARTPERQRLADAIMERDRRAALVEAKRAEIKAIEERDYSIWRRRDELEELVRHLGSAPSEAARRDALLRGETLRPEQDTDGVRSELAEVLNELARSKKATAELLTDIQLLNTPCMLAESSVEKAVEAVLMADPARIAIVDELAKLMRRVTQLRRAAYNTFRSDAADRYNPADAVRGPCPWETVKARLATDPDARLPMPDDAFAEPPPRSAA